MIKATKRIKWDKGIKRVTGVGGEAVAGEGSGQPPQDRTEAGM